MEASTKKIVIVGAAIVGGVLLIRYLNKKKGATSESNFDYGTGGSGGSGGSGGTGTAGGTPLPYSSLANTLFAAFDGYGTDEDAVYEVFKQMRNDEDVNNLIAAFGTRTVSSGKGNIFVSDFVGKLPAVIKDEMSSTNISQINDILRRNGISYSF